jgi:lincosamide nucleotidyltransferase A/C/D/E
MVDGVSMHSSIGNLALIKTWTLFLKTGTWYDSSGSSYRGGYSRSKREIERPFNFVLADRGGREIDVHVISLDENGNGIYGAPENGLAYPADSLTGTGTISGCAVRCISPHWVVKFHSGYELTEKDYQDVSAICEKYGMAVPDE